MDFCNWLLIKFNNWINKFKKNWDITSSVMVWAFIVDFFSIQKMLRVLPANKSQQKYTIIHPSCYYIIKNTYPLEQSIRRPDSWWLNLQWMDFWWGLFCWIMQVNDDHLCCFSHLLSDTDEFVRLHRESAESDVGSIDSNTCEPCKLWKK